MGEARLSRREALGALGGALLSATAARPAPPEPAGDAVPEPIIDAHVHVVEPRLPGAFESPIPLPRPGKDGGKALDLLIKVAEVEAKKAGVAQALCMPRVEVSDQDPLGVRDTLAIAGRVRGVKLHPVGLAHPERYDRDHLARVEGVLKGGKVKALKAYLGYLHYGPSHPGYRKYYALAARYKVPVVFHCGDTWSRTAKVKYAHPLKVDEVAVDYPDTRFVIAHFGNPWLMDAAQVAARNDNVWIDLSAVVVGETFKKEKADLLRQEAERVRKAVRYVDEPKKFLFGSDWPLTPVGVYADFVRGIFPKEQHAAVFRKNAEGLFGL
jgi:predicted TIM-barrel fold metal-dependent hydrolase